MSGAPARRGGYAKGRERREAILAAANDVFAAQGFHAASLSSIATRVGLSDAGLLHHFPSKEHLLHAVAEHRIAAIAESWGRFDPEAGLTEVLQELVSYTERFLEQPGLIELSVLTSAEAADPSSPAHAAFAESYRQAVDGLSAIFERCAARGELVPGTDCTALARECIAVSDGLQLQWVLSDGGKDLAAGIRAHAERIAATVSRQAG